VSIRCLFSLLAALHNGALSSSCCWPTQETARIWQEEMREALVPGYRSFALTRQRLWHTMPTESQEESISSMQQTRPGFARSLAADLSVSPTQHDGQDIPN
jgi:hypothetical protein